MRSRVNKIVGFGAEQVWVSAFHSACVRILRRYIDRIGYSTDFTIYDTDDQKRLMKNIIKELNLNTKIYKENAMLGKISDFKNKLITTGDVAAMARNDFKMVNISKIYDEYQEALKKNNALDFDDLIMKTVQLFNKCPEVLEGYQNRLQYIMVMMTSLFTNSEGLILQIFCSLKSIFQMQGWSNWNRITVLQRTY